MPADTLDIPAERLGALLRVQGRKLLWVAHKARMSPETLRCRLIGKRYVWRTGQREAIADALGVPVWFIWPELRPASDQTPRSLNAALAEAEAEDSEEPQGEQTEGEELG